MKKTLLFIFCSLIFSFVLGHQVKASSVSFYCIPGFYSFKYVNVGCNNNCNYDDCNINNNPNNCNYDNCNYDDCNYYDCNINSNRNNCDYDNCNNSCYYDNCNQSKGYYCPDGSWNDGYYACPMYSLCNSCSCTNSCYVPTTYNPCNSCNCRNYRNSCSYSNKNNYYLDYNSRTRNNWPGLVWATWSF